MRKKTHTRGVDTRYPHIHKKSALPSGYLPLNRQVRGGHKPQGIYPRKQPQQNPLLSRQILLKKLDPKKYLHDHLDDASNLAQLEQLNTKYFKGLPKKKAALRSIIKLDPTEVNVARALNRSGSIDAAADIWLQYNPDSKINAAQISKITNRYLIRQHIYYDILFTSREIEINDIEINDADTLVREFFHFNLREELNKYPFIRKYEITSTKFTVSFQSYGEFLLKSYEAYLSKGDLSKPYEEFFSKRVKFPTLSAKNLLAEGENVPTLDQYHSVCRRLESWVKQNYLALQQEKLYQVLNAYVVIDPIDRLNEEFQQMLVADCAESAAVAAQKAANNTLCNTSKICGLYKQATYSPRIQSLYEYMLATHEFLWEYFSKFITEDALLAAYLNHLDGNQLIRNSKEFQQYWYDALNENKVLNQIIILIKHFPSIPRTLTSPAGVDELDTDERAKMTIT